MNKIKLILVDDHKMLLTGLATELDKLEEFCIINTLTDPEQLTDVIAECTPDVVVMDIRMGRYNGIALTKEIKAIYPRIKVVLISGYNISWLAKDCGADAFFSKEDSISSLASTIQKVFLDEVIVFPNKEPATAALTKTELIVLQLISEDKTRKEICSEMFISDKTVTNHITSILHKLDVRSRVGAIMKGVELGLIDNKYKDES